MSTSSAHMPGAPLYRGLMVATVSMVYGPSGSSATKGTPLCQAVTRILINYTPSAVVYVLPLLKLADACFAESLSRVEGMGS